ncbi:MAG TPA: glycogen debranching enzyme N-terminal domain-containing protein, partial [Chitinophagaceae bacterium]|nr:glycogen debranching enzyme N-terminal domain-containing protein [Chitinophagaceae bacterium]
MPLTKSGIELHDLNNSIQLEWLETNGLGGWAASSLSGCNTRRYHALLMAATDPPTGRMNLVSKMDETITISSHRFELGVNDYGSAIQPSGHTFLSRFSKGLFPEWIYELPGLTLNKIVFMPNGENTTIILYNVLRCDGNAEMEILPLMAVRDYHQLVRANEKINTESIFGDNILRMNLYPGSPEIFIKVPEAVFESNPSWYYNLHFAMEKDRGLECMEDLFSPGKFIIQMKAGDSFGLVISTEDPARKKPFESYVKEKQRRSTLFVGHPKDEMLRQLLLAADQFIVNRGEEGKSIIAGYHWFTDWSRDAMISFPGLCLSTGRFEDAKKILTAFARHISMGMLPNRFLDNQGPPEYNNVDGTLWYFIAIHKYLLATG